LSSNDLLHGVQRRPVCRVAHLDDCRPYGKELDRVCAPPPVRLLHTRAHDASAPALDRLGLHALQRTLARGIGRVGVDLHLLIAPGLLEHLHEAQMRDVIDARSHRETHWPVARPDELPEILAAQVGRERAIVLRAEAPGPLAMPDGGTNRLEFQHTFIHRVLLEHEANTHYAISAEQVRLFLHARHRELACLEHGLGQHHELLAHTPPLPLEADVINGRAQDQTERFETGLLDQEELINCEVAREEGRPLSCAAHRAQSLGGATGQIRG